MRGTTSGLTSSRRASTAGADAGGGGKWEPLVSESSPQTSPEKARRGAGGRGGGGVGETVVPGQFNASVGGTGLDEGERWTFSRAERAQQRKQRKKEKKARDQTMVRFFVLFLFFLLF